MSLDLTLTAVRPCSVFDGNITHNLARMAEACGLYPLMWGARDRTAGDLIEPLRVALAELVVNPEKYRAFDPPNGWGSYDGLVQFASEFLEACIANPDATVGVFA